MRKTVTEEILELQKIPTSLSNEKCSFFLTEKCIKGYEKGNFYGTVEGYQMFTRAKRNMLKAWKKLVESKMIEEGARFFDVVKFLDEEKQKCHVYLQD